MQLMESFNFESNIEVSNLFPLLHSLYQDQKNCLLTSFKTTAQKYHGGWITVDKSGRTVRIGNIGKKNRNTVRSSYDLNEFEIPYVAFLLACYF